MSSYVIHQLPAAGMLTRDCPAIYPTAEEWQDFEAVVSLSHAHMRACVRAHSYTQLMLLDGGLCRSKKRSKLQSTRAL
jgi:hypothetical protein